MPKAKERKGQIDNRFRELIGEVVIEFGRLEDLLRHAAVQIICPAVPYPENLAICARTRFSELVDLYEFIVLWTLEKCCEDEELSPEQKDLFTNALKAIKAQMNSVNERRNNVVHSTYLEVEEEHYSPVLGFVPKGKFIEGIKPFLHRRAVTGSEGFYKTGAELEEEARSLIAEIRLTYQNALNFDHSVIPCTNWIWDDFSGRAIEQRKRESKKARAD